MSVLTECDYLALLHCIRRLGDVEDVSSAHRTILSAVVELVPCEHVTYNELPTREGRPGVAIWNLADLETTSLRLYPAFVEHLHTHPIANDTPRVPPSSRQKPARVRKISDYLNNARFRGLGIYQDVYRHLDTEYQLVAQLPTSGQAVVGVAINRKGADFSERDRKLMELLSPHLTQAYDRLGRRVAARQLIAGAPDVRGEEVLRERLARETPTLRSQRLTDREAHVLLWIVRGKTNPEIGLILSISPRTVQKHLEHVFAKCGVESRSACVAHVLDAWR